MDRQKKNHRRHYWYIPPTILPHFTFHTHSHPTDDALLQKKANKHVMESIHTRIAHVRAFLQLFRPGIEYQTVSIDDVYGPTATDPDIQALVVSRETISGAQSSESLRPFSSPLP